jgi:hypothetical protein
LVVHLFARMKYILDNIDDGQICKKISNTFVFAILLSFSVQISDKYSIWSKCRRGGSCNRHRNAVAFLNVLTRKYDTFFRVGGGSWVSELNIILKYNSTNLSLYSMF